MIETLDRCDCGWVFNTFVNNECPHCKDIDAAENGGDD